jgi:coatomer protein complex subunit epsilon
VPTADTHPRARTCTRALQVGLHLGKSTARFASQLKVVAPQHPLVLRAAAGEEAFDRAAAAAVA